MERKVQIFHAIVVWKIWAIVVMAYNIELVNYFKKTMSKSHFNIYMDFLGWDVIGIGDEDDYDPYTTNQKEKEDV